VGERKPQMSENSTRILKLLNDYEKASYSRLAETDRLAKNENNNDETNKEIVCNNNKLNHNKNEETTKDGKDTTQNIERGCDKTASRSISQEDFKTISSMLFKSDEGISLNSHNSDIGPGGKNLNPKGRDQKCYANNYTQRDKLLEQETDETKDSSTDGEAATKKKKKKTFQSLVNDSLSSGSDDVVCIQQLYVTPAIEETYASLVPTVAPKKKKKLKRDISTAKIGKKKQTWAPQVQKRLMKPSMSENFHNRDSYFFKRAAENTKDIGRMSVVLVGEPGVGKTTLLRSLGAQLDVGENDISFSKYYRYQSKKKTTFTMEFPKKEDILNCVNPDQLLKEHYQTNLRSHFTEIENIGPKMFSVSLSSKDYLNRTTFLDFDKEYLDLFPFYISQKSIILVVFNSVTERKQPTLRYWLKRIRQVTFFLQKKNLFSNEWNFKLPTVYLVGTHADSRRRSLSMTNFENYVADLRKEFPNVKGYFVVAPSSKNTSILALKKMLMLELDQHSSSIEEFARQVPPATFLLKNYIQNLIPGDYNEDGEGKPIITLEEFREVCKIYSLEETTQNRCLRFWGEQRFLRHIDKKQKSGWESDNKQVSLADYVFLDFKLLAHAYYLLLTYIRLANYIYSTGSFCNEFLGTIRLSDISIVWPHNLFSPTYHQVFLMLFEELELIHPIKARKNSLQAMLVDSSGMTWEKKISTRITPEETNPEETDPQEEEKSTKSRLNRSKSLDGEKKHSSLGFDISKIMDRSISLAGETMSKIKDRNRDNNDTHQAPEVLNVDRRKGNPKKKTSSENPGGKVSSSESIQLLLKFLENSMGDTDSEGSDIDFSSTRGWRKTRTREQKKNRGMKRSKSLEEQREEWNKGQPDETSSNKRTRSQSDDNYLGFSRTSSGTHRIPVSGFTSHNLALDRKHNDAWERELEKFKNRRKGCETENKDENVEGKKTKRKKRISNKNVKNERYAGTTKQNEQKSIHNTNKHQDDTRNTDNKEDDTTLESDKETNKDSVRLQTDDNTKTKNDLEKSIITQEHNKAPDTENTNNTNNLDFELDRQGSDLLYSHLKQGTTALLKSVHKQGSELLYSHLKQGTTALLKSVHKQGSELLYSHLKQGTTALLANTHGGSGSPPSDQDSKIDFQNFLDSLCDPDDDDEVSVIDSLTNKKAIAKSLDESDKLFYHSLATGSKKKMDGTQTPTLFPEDDPLPSTSDPPDNSQGPDELTTCGGSKIFFTSTLSQTNTPESVHNTAEKSLYERLTSSLFEPKEADNFKLEFKRKRKLSFNNPSYKFNFNRHYSTNSLNHKTVNTETTPRNKSCEPTIPKLKPKKKQQSQKSPKKSNLSKTTKPESKKKTLIPGKKNIGKISPRKPKKRKSKEKITEQIFPDPKSEQTQKTETTQEKEEHEKKEIEEEDVDEKKKKVTIEEECVERSVILVKSTGQNYKPSFSLSSSSSRQGVRSHAVARIRRNQQTVEKFQKDNVNSDDHETLILVPIALPLSVKKKNIKREFHGSVVSKQNKIPENDEVDPEYSTCLIRKEKVMSSDETMKLLKQNNWIPPQLFTFDQATSRLQKNNSEATTIQKKKGVLFTVGREKWGREALIKQKELPTQTRHFLFHIKPHFALPIGLFDRLIARFVELNIVKIVWRNRVLVFKGTEKALLEVYPSLDCIIVSVYGDRQDKMWNLITFNIKDVSRYWYNTNPIITAPCPHCMLLGSEDPYVFMVSECEATMGQGMDFVYCLHNENRHPVSVGLNQLVPDISLANLESLQIEYKDIMILNTIAEGEFSSVKKGVYENKQVAVKVFIKTHITDKFHQGQSLELLNEFRSEVIMMSGLDHPNVVELIGFTKDPLSLVMEFVDTDLMHFLQDNPREDVHWTTRLAIALDIANGMLCLHSSFPPIIHRDLKSTNILLNSMLQAKVTDFGLSTVYSTKTAERQVDNPLWLAPEIIKGEIASEKADVYSFAIILWEISSHKSPYSEYSWTFGHELEEQIGDGLRPTFLEGTPLLYKKLVEKCWSDNPESRPPFNQIVETLENLSNYLLESPLNFFVE